MRFFEQIKSPIVCLVFSPDGRALAAACDKCMKVGMWELPGGKFWRWHPYAERPVRSVAYSGDGVCLAVGNDKGWVLAYVAIEDDNAPVFTYQHVRRFEVAMELPHLMQAIYSFSKLSQSSPQASFIQ